MKTLLVILLVSLSFAHQVHAQDDKKEAIHTSEQKKENFAKSPFQFNAATRAGDFVYVSGVIAGKSPRETDGPFTREKYEASIHRAFVNIQNRLKAAGGSTEDIVHLRTFHLFDSEILPMSKKEHVMSIVNVKGEFIGEPFHSWTAVGTTGLFSPTALVEIEAVAYIPQK